ncbi:MAG: hypothetical protein ACO1OQ_01325 [Rufibacter sp.]
MKFFTKVLFYLTLSALAFSCTEEATEDPIPQPRKELSKWQMAMLTIEQIATEVEAPVRNTYTNSNSFLNCASVLNELTDEGLQTTFTFSNTPCVDGKVRSGKMVMLTNNESNRVSTIYLENYTIDGSKIEGSFMLELINVPGKTGVLNMISMNGRVLPANGQNFGFSISRKSHQKEGLATVYDNSDDLIELYEGEYTCILPDGAFEATITAPIQVKRLCPAPTNIKPLQGKILIELTTGQKSTLNFGDGTCSATAFSE